MKVFLNKFSTTPGGNLTVLPADLIPGRQVHRHVNGRSVPGRRASTTGRMRDNVDVEVHHRPAGGGAHIHADIAAIGVAPAVEEGFRLPEEGEEGGEFRVEEVGDMAVGDDEEVAGADWIPIIAGVAEAVCEDDLFFWGLQNGQVRGRTSTRLWGVKGVF